MKKKSSLRQLIQFCIAALLLYFIVKVPIMWFVTDILHIHYVLSGAIAGAVVTLASFIPSKWWIFNVRKKSDSDSSCQE